MKYKIMNEIKLWWLRNFRILSSEEVTELNLIWVRNVYGDEINLLNCRSIWKDLKGRYYKCHLLLK